MAIRPIITAPDPRLTETAAPVERVDDEVRLLMEDMLDSMHAARGIGLAAPQIGVAKRVIVIDIDREGVQSGPLFLANPEIVAVSDEDYVYEEGCLSVPEHYAEVVRPGGVTLRYLDRENEIREMQADGILAVCLQHEIDHLDGILFIDHLSSLKRNIILRKLTKAKKAAAEATV